MGRRAQGTDIILHGVPTGEIVGSLSTGPCEGSGDGHLSP